jgi:hypothetical protein
MLDPVPFIACHFTHDPKVFQLFDIALDHIETADLQVVGWVANPPKNFLIPQTATSPSLVDPRDDKNFPYTQYLIPVFPPSPSPIPIKSD